MIPLPMPAGRLKGIIPNYLFNTLTLHSSLFTLHSSLTPHPYFPISHFLLPISGIVFHRPFDRKTARHRFFTISFFTSDQILATIYFFPNNSSLFPITFPLATRYQLLFTFLIPLIFKLNRLLV